MPVIRPCDRRRQRTCSQPGSRGTTQVWTNESSQVASIASGSPVSPSQQPFEPGQRWGQSQCQDEGDAGESLFFLDNGPDAR